MRDLLKEISRIDGIEGSLLLDSDGLVVSSRLPEEFAEETTAALVADLCRSVTQSVGGVSRGRFIAGYIFAASGSMLYFHGPDFILAVFASASANIGAIRLALRNSAKDLLKEI